MVRLLQPAYQIKAPLFQASETKRDQGVLLSMFDNISIRVARHPMPLLAAATRLSLGAHEETAPRNDHGNLPAPVPILASSTKHLAPLVFGCILKVLETGCQNHCHLIDKHKHKDLQDGEFVPCSPLCCRQFVTTVLTVPGISLPDQFTTSLMDKKVMLPLTYAVCEMCDAMTLSRSQAFCCLAYLCQNVAVPQGSGCSVQINHVTSVSHTILSRSSLLTDKTNALAYVLAVTSLLQRIGATNERRDSNFERYQIGTVNESRYWNHDVEALMELWPLSHPTHAVQLLDILEDYGNGVELFSELQLALLQVSQFEEVDRF